MAKTNPPTPAVAKKIQALAKLAVDLHQGQHFNITRLTVLKGFCSDPDAAAKFALQITKLAQTQFKARSKATKSQARQRYERLIAAAIPAMTRRLKSPTEERKSKLWELYKQAKEAQSQYEHQQWCDVRIIECRELLIVETAMECLLNPWNASLIGYRVARQYAEKYDPHYGTGLLPKSAPMVEEIAAFWGSHFFGRGWKKVVGREEEIRRPNSPQSNIITPSLLSTWLLAAFRAVVEAWAIWASSIWLRHLHGHEWLGAIGALVEIDLLT